MEHFDKRSPSVTISNSVGRADFISSIVVPFATVIGSGVFKPNILAFLVALKVHVIFNKLLLFYVSVATLLQSLIPATLVESTNIHPSTPLSVKTALYSVL